PAGVSGFTDFDFHHGRYAQSDNRGNITLRRIADDRQEGLLPGSGARVYRNLTFGHDGGLLAVAYQNLRCAVWNLETLKPVFDRTNLLVNAFDISADAHWLAVCIGTNGEEIV